MVFLFHFVTRRKELKDSESERAGERQKRFSTERDFFRHFSRLSLSLFSLSLARSLAPHGQQAASAPADASGRNRPRHSEQGDVDADDCDSRSSIDALFLGPYGATSGR